MFTSMKKLSLATGVSLFALVGTATAENTVKVSQIDVDTSFSAVEDSNAATFFPEISEDVRKAIATRVATSEDAIDPTIRVDIRKIALDGSGKLAGNGEFNELEGVVDISSPDGDIGAVSFPINITAVSGDKVIPEGYTVVPPSKDDFYNVMVNAFAMRVAEELSNVNTAGDGVSK